MLCELINDDHNRLRRNSLGLTSLQGALHAQLSPEHFTMLEEEIASQLARTHNRRRNELSSKFLGLLTPRQANRTPKVINLSQRALNSADSSILERGMKSKTPLMRALRASFETLNRFYPTQTSPGTFAWSFQTQWQDK